MALVSAGGMGEAVLGIASEVVNNGQDGGVFTGLKTEKIAVLQQRHYTESRAQR